MSNASAAFLAVVPAYNEADTVAEVVKSIAAAFPAALILVVDDGSSDGTGLAASAAGAIVARHVSNLGVGAAMRTGFRFAQQRGCDIVVQVDADGQHDPAQIPRLIAGLETSDVVVGSRFAAPSDYQLSGPRRWAIRLLSWSVSRLCGVRLTDATSGFRATGARGIALFARHYPTEYLGDTVESLALAGRVGLRVGEVAVSMRKRQGGRPSQSFVSGVLNLARAAFVVIQASLRAVPPDAPRLIEARS